jgi:hypothetical protein
LNERFSPLAAYYLPGVKAEDLPPNMTSVNLFRFVFNHYFNAGLPLLENREYSFQNKEYIFEPLDVTDRVGETCPIGPVPGSAIPGFIKIEYLFGQ